MSPTPNSHLPSPRIFGIRHHGPGSARSLRAALEQLRAILHASPRAFGRARSTWTLGLLARVAHEQGLSARVLSPETIRQALVRLGVGWRRAKRWLTSPDPAYVRKKTDATA